MTIYETRKELESRLSAAKIRGCRVSWTKGTSWLNVYCPSQISGVMAEAIYVIAAEMKINVDLH